MEKVMHERKKGTLKSGGSGKTVKSRKQAIAIGLSEARRAGAKVPKKKAARKKSATKKKTASRTGPSRKKSATTRSTRKKSVTKKRGRG